MYVDAKNVNYGYAVATHGKYVAVGNPNHIRYDISTASLYQTGSVDVFRYDSNTDSHLYVHALHKPIYPTESVLLTTEVSNILQTETDGYDFAYRNKDIAVDDLRYITSSENCYGHSIDWFNKRLAVGCPWYAEQTNIDGHQFDFSSSGVDIWDYTYSERNRYTYNDQPSVVGSGFTGSTGPAIAIGDTSSVDLTGVDLTTRNYYYEVVQVPPGYDEVWVSMVTPATDFGVVCKLRVPPEGGYATYAFTSSLYAGSTASYQGIITNEIRYFHIENPNTAFSNSFGQAVSLNENWLAVGSPYVSSSKGTVYLYKNICTGSTLSWSLYQRLEPTSLVGGQKFGWDVSLNKSNAIACPNRLVVGCGAADNRTVYLFELSASTWIESHQFHQITSSLYPQTFDSSSYPILLSSS
jgi:hypothetical protein